MTTGLKRSVCFDFHFAAKLVRGGCAEIHLCNYPRWTFLRSYARGALLLITLSYEITSFSGSRSVHGARTREGQDDYQDPIHETAERTHRCYDEHVELLLRHRPRRGPGLEIMIATHNEASIGRAADLMSELGIAPNDVHFAQLWHVRQSDGHPR